MPGGLAAGQGHAQDGTGNEGEAMHKRAQQISNES
jgi:hypothetical protein